MKFFLSLTLILLPFIITAQPGYRVFDFIDPSLKSFSVSTSIGTSYYYGDLCATNDCYTKSNFNFGIGSTIRLNDYFFFNIDLNRYRIEGADANGVNISRLKRNLSFRSDNYELNFIGNFEFLNYNTFRYLTRTEFPLCLFTFTGLGLTTNNPKTFYQGRWVELRPLKTEGVDYSPIALTIPFGIGVGYRFTRNLNVDFTVGYRFTTTDYLDDVSTDYEDPNSFSNPLAKELQYRGDEISIGKPQTLFGPDGPVRGNPRMKDGYLLMGFKAEWKLPKVKLNFLGPRFINRGGPKNQEAKPIRRPATRRSN